MRKRWMLLAALFLPCVAHADRIIVKMAEPSGYSTAIASVNAAKVLDLELVGAEVWEVADSAAAIAGLSADPNVEYAEPDLYATLCVMPNDSCFVNQWWLHNTLGGCAAFDDDVDAPEAWDIMNSSSFIIANLDTGTDYTNGDLNANQWINVDEIPGNGWDDDGNGYRDDWRGWDFGGTGQGDNNCTDTFGHGTATYSIMASRGNNGHSFAGGAWSVPVMTVKVANSQGLQTSLIIKGLGYAKDNGARIIQNSWVLYGYSNSLIAALNAVNNAGILMVTPAGNDYFDMDVCGASTCYQIPASLHLSNNITVGASTCDQIAPFSNRGASYVDIVAPGMWIPHATPGVYCNYNGDHGTSWSSPIVAACAALVWEQNPTYTAAQVKTRILTTVDWVPAMYGEIASGGKVNYCKALGGCGGAGSGCENPPCEIENESIVPPPDETMALTLSLTEARERADLYDVTGRKVKAQRPGIYFQRVERAGVVTRRTVVVR